MPPSDPFPTDFSLPPPSLALTGVRSALQAAASNDARHAPSPADTFRASLDLAVAIGFRAVQLDATAAGLRPRDLDRSARRDLAATLRRAELTCAGIDLLIPPQHFTDPTHADRAAEALFAAIDLAADLGTLTESAVVSRARSALAPIVTVSLPAPDDPALASGLIQRVDALGDSRRVRIADLTLGRIALIARAAQPDGTFATTSSNRPADAPLGAALDVQSAWSTLADPATSILSRTNAAPAAQPNKPSALLTGPAIFGADPASPADHLAALVARLGPALVSLRVSEPTPPATRIPDDAVQTIRTTLAAVSGLLSTGAPTTANGRLGRASATSSVPRTVIDPRPSADPTSAARRSLAQWS